MRERNYQYIPGDPWLICDECGFKYRRSEMKKRWDGFMVCEKDYEPRHPQEFVRGRKDKISFPDSRPDYDSQLGSNLLSTPDYIDAAITNNGDGTFTLDGTQTSDAFIVWHDVLSNGSVYRATTEITDYSTGRCKFSTVDSISQSELVTNGTFDTDTSGWEVFSGLLTVVSGRLRLTDDNVGGSYPAARQTITTIPGRVYKLTFDMYKGTAPGIILHISDSSLTTMFSFPLNVDGSKVVTFKATTNTSRLSFFAGAAGGVYSEFDNVSVKQIQNLVENGEFSSDRAWTKGTGWTISGGLAVGAAGIASHLQQDSSLPAVGSKVTITFTVSGWTAGTVTPYAGSGAAGTPRGADGTYTEVLTVTTDTNFSLYKDATFDGDIDNVEVYELTDSETNYIDTGYISGNGNYLSEAEQEGANDFIVFMADENFVGTIEPKLQLVTGTNSTTASAL